MCTQRATANELMYCKWPHLHRAGVVDDVEICHHVTRAVPNEAAAKTGGGGRGARVQQRRGRSVGAGQAGNMGNAGLAPAGRLHRVSVDLQCSCTVHT